jgi:FkbM family methyltransferase
VQWLNQHVGAGDVVYDIGANVGAFSLIAAIARGAHVVSFEPGYANFARLCENIALNRCGDRVLAVPLPLSDANGPIRFLYKGGVEAGHSRHKCAGRWTFKRRGGVKSNEQAMCGIRLDDARTLLSLPVPSHLKLDVDGSELAVLRGANETLNDNTLRTLLVEVEPALWPEVSDLLGQAGFNVAAYMPRSEAPTYALFLRRMPSVAGPT